MTSNRQYTIGVDIGASQIRALRFIVGCSPDGPIEDSEVVTCETPKSFTPEPIIEAISSCIRRVLPKDSNDVAIGICAPGPIDPKRQRFINPPNLPGLHGVHLGEQLGPEFRKAHWLIRDTFAAVLAEQQYGAAKGCDNCAYVTVSSGIGAAFIVNRQLMMGHNGVAGECGHIRVAPPALGHMCGCGSIGHLEAEASGLAVTKLAQEGLRYRPGTVASLFPKGAPLTADKVFNMCRRMPRHPGCQELVRHVGTMLGTGLATIITLFNPEKVVLGGSMWFGAKDLLLPHIQDTLHQELIPRDFKCELVDSVLGDKVGLYGGIVAVEKYPYPG